MNVYVNIGRMADEISLQIEREFEGNTFPSTAYDICEAAKRILNEYPYRNIPLDIKRGILKDVLKRTSKTIGWYLR